MEQPSCATTVLDRHGGTMGSMGTPLFGPNSMMWRINSEPALLLGARAALLMQLAHPLVAAAVARHSHFRHDPMGRLRATLRTVSTIAFGTEEQARAAALRVNGLHTRVNGRAPWGERYSATDPHLLLWVYSTLVDTAVGVYGCFVSSLTDSEREAFYDESKIVAHLFEVPEEHLPASFHELRAWMRERIESGEVTVTPLARELATSLLRPVTWIPEPAARRMAVVLAALLPEELRMGYDLPLGRPARFTVGALGRLSRMVTPRMPRAAKRLVLSPLL
jgi:uncharacterized protein (DUF2236 family)